MIEASVFSYILISIAALVASGLTLFSGFGLGTLLMPAFALFFPIEVAVALTAVVHLANNVLKLGLLGRHADRSVALRFGLPAIIAALVGAALLETLAGAAPVLSWSLFGRILHIEPVKLVVGGLMVLFAVVEILPAFERWSVPVRYLPVGGILSGFFGGLSGHQGAFRSVFLMRCTLSKESFIGTGVAIAVLVDITRIPVYAGSFGPVLQEHAMLLGVAVGSAFAGLLIATRLLKKVTIRANRITVTIMLIIVGSILAMGVL